MPSDSHPPTDSLTSQKFIFVTGGVMSGLGKGITAASTGRLLKNAGFDVTAVKVDPYLNVDAGTMNPYQHGEVFVLKDGAEVDLDLGNYERFLDIEMTGMNNITTGKVYQHVIDKERAGDYLGKTVQIIPHITEEIRRRIREAADGYDICIVELGGTVGDIEGMPFLEAVRQFVQEEVPNDSLHIHVTLVPYSQTDEQKTKPTQHSVKELRSLGLQPDILVGRCDDRLHSDVKEKIALFCDVPSDAVFSNPDVDDIYKVPLMIHDDGLDEYVMDQLGIYDDAPEPTERELAWRDLITQDASETVGIALVGKYDLEDAYISIHESLKHAGFEHGVDVHVDWVAADEMTAQHRARLQSADGVIVPGGFGSRGLEGKIQACEYARTNGVPFLGLCLGFQTAVIEFARNCVGLSGAHSAEVDDETPHPVIDILPEQKELDEMGGTMRLGAHETDIEAGTLAAELYGDSCLERHRHRYEVNPDYIEQLEAAGIQFSGQSGRRMEILELPSHPYYLGTQFHPEFTSRPGDPNPAFTGLVAAALNET